VTGGWYLHEWFSPAPTAGSSSDAEFTSDAPSSSTEDVSSDAVPASAFRSTGISTPSAAHASPTRIVYRNVVITRIDTVFIPRTDASTVADAVTPGSHRVEYRRDTVLVALMQTTQDQRPITIIERPDAAPAIPLPSRFEIEVQRAHLTTWPYIDYNRIGVERAQQHLSASVGYVFSDHHAVGITAGETSFAMEYYRVENDSLFLFQRQPALFYGAGFYRYAQPLLPGLTPEISLLLGGCDYGPVLGARLGVRIDAFAPLSLLVGVNGTLLTYQYKDRLFNSHNLGLTYGIRYRF
jgi:hypothetical protein